MLGDPDTVNEFIATPPRRNQVFGILGSAAFVAAGAWMASSATSTVPGLVGILCILFFGLTGIITLVNFVRPRAMTFTPEGLHLAGLAGNKFVEWKNVEAIGITTYQSTK